MARRWCGGYRGRSCAGMRASLASLMRSSSRSSATSCSRRSTRARSRTRAEPAVGAPRPRACERDVRERGEMRDRPARPSAKRKANPEDDACGNGRANLRREASLAGKPRRLGDARDDRIELLEDLMIRHAQHGPAELLERAAPLRIMTPHARRDTRRRLRRRGVPWCMRSRQCAHQRRADGETQSRSWSRRAFSKATPSALARSA